MLYSSVMFQEKTALSDLQHLATPELASDKCFGVLHGEGVLVLEEEDISRLVHLGCYGKGIFSRSAPAHHRLPQLSELVRPSKRKRSETVGGAARVSSSTDSENSSGLAAAGWVDKIKCLEAVELARLGLHSEWKSEKEDLAQKSDKSQAIAEQASSVCGVESSDSEMKEDTKKSAEASSVEKSYDDFIHRIKELRKTDPFPVKEHLQLTSEEATYLAVELNILQVSSTDKTPLNSETLWSHFLEANGRFVERYTAYRYYRSKGWVPKSGLKFGVDFLLYKEGPSFYHSTYAVIVSLVEDSESGLESVSGPPQSGLTWREVIALDRVNEAAGKEMIVCFVMKPPSLSQQDMKLPGCVDSLQVREVFVKRWVPEKERENK